MAFERHRLILSKNGVTLLGAAHKSILSCETSNGRLGGGGKRTGRFQKFCFIDISPENFLQGTLFCSYSFAVYIVNVKEFR